jgi:hypothetical protein
VKRCAIELNAADADGRVYVWPRTPIAEVTDRNFSVRRALAAPTEGAEISQNLAVTCQRGTEG